jgi:hypothetical protein
MSRSRLDSNVRKKQDDEEKRRMCLLGLWCAVLVGNPVPPAEHLRAMPRALTFAATLSVLLRSHVVDSVF